jgi:hypothetical protein
VTARSPGRPGSRHRLAAASLLLAGGVLAALADVGDLLEAAWVDRCPAAGAADDPATPGPDLYRNPRPRHRGTVVLPATCAPMPSRVATLELADLWRPLVLPALGSSPLHRLISDHTDRGPPRS